jgi:hypothetical protein
MWRVDIYREKSWRKVKSEGTRTPRRSKRQSSSESSIGTGRVVEDLSLWRIDTLGERKWRSIDYNSSEVE